MSKEARKQGRKRGREEERKRGRKEERKGRKGRLAFEGGMTV